MINFVILAGFGLCACILYAAVQKFVRSPSVHMSCDEDDLLCILMDDPDYIQLLNGNIDMHMCRITSASGKEIHNPIENIPFDLAIVSEDNYEYVSGMKCLSGKCDLHPIYRRNPDNDDKCRDIRILYSEKFSDLIRKLVSKGIIREAKYIM